VAAAWVVAVVVSAVVVLFSDLLCCRSHRASHTVML
jgi:hypothetical protein